MDHQELSQIIKYQKRLHQVATGIRPEEADKLEDSDSDTEKKLPETQNQKKNDQKSQEWKEEDIKAFEKDVFRNVDPAKHDMPPEKDSPQYSFDFDKNNKQTTEPQQSNDVMAKYGQKSPEQTQEKTKEIEKDER